MPRVLGAFLHRWSIDRLFRPVVLLLSASSKAQAPWSVFYWSIHQGFDYAAGRLRSIFSLTMRIGDRARQPATDATTRNLAIA